MSVEIRDSQVNSSLTSWMPSANTLAWGALALGTIVSIGALCYSSFPGAEGSGINQCYSPAYINDLSKDVVDLCGSDSPVSSLCEGNLGILRSMMPQVNSSTLNLFLAEKSSQGILFQEEIVNPNDLIPVQSEMNLANVAGMISSYVQGSWDPCKERILSAGGYVLDGHHRWAACSFLDRAMTILNIEDTAQNILSELANFKGVFSVGLTQRV